MRQIPDVGAGPALSSTLGWRSPACPPAWITLWSHKHYKVTAILSFREIQTSPWVLCEKIARPTKKWDSKQCLHLLIAFGILLLLQEATWYRDLSVAVRCFSLKLKSHTRVDGVSVLLHSFSHYYQPQQQPEDSLKGICGVISSSQLADVHYIQVAPKCHRSPIGTDPVYRCHFFFFTDHLFLWKSPKMGQGQWPQCQQTHLASDRVTDHLVPSQE